MEPCPSLSSNFSPEFPGNCIGTLCNLNSISPNHLNAFIPSSSASSRTFPSCANLPAESSKTKAANMDCQTCLMGGCGNEGEGNMTVSHLGVKD